MENEPKPKEQVDHAISYLTDRWKAGQTCAAHLLAVLLFYVPMTLLALVDRLRVPLPQPAHTLLSYVHFLLPPLINPIL
ncbi:hypothetical protein PS028_24020, partial [Shigella sonnei]|nr:hypothetical protein [Shigella sonnei]